jgi:Tol biopolymer transport system component
MAEKTMFIHIGRRPNCVRNGMSLLIVLGLAALASGQPHQIYYGDSRAGQISLFVANADGSGERPLLEPSGADYDPAWSPDGQWILFTSERNGSADLYRIKPDGTQLEQLTDHQAYDDQAAWSPDGKRIVFVSTRGNGHANLWVLDVLSRSIKQLTSGNFGDFRPAWSPDGKWIAFSSDRGTTFHPATGRWESVQVAKIFIIHPDSSGLKALSQQDDFCGSPKWSRDSTHVVTYCMSADDTFTYRERVADTKQGETRLVSMDIATAKSQSVAAGPGVKMSPSILPSGEIAYTRKDMGAPGIFYGTGRPGPQGNARSPSWSPDGARVVYHRVGSAYRSGGSRIWSRNAQFELFYSGGMLPSFEPSGQRYVSMSVSGGKFAVTVFTADTHERTIVFQDKDRSVVAAQWSPLGDSILFSLGGFTSFRSFDPRRDPLNGGAQVAMVKPDGSGFRELTSGANNNGFPSFSPDAKRFVYRTFGPEGQGLRIRDLESGKTAVLTDQYDNFPLWSPRGDLIAFVRQYQGDYEVFSIRPDGKDLRRLTNSPGNEAHLAWSPDGEWLLFSSSRMGFKDEALYTDAPQPYGELFMMRYDGTHVQQLTDNQWEDAGPGWRPEQTQNLKR